MRFCSTRDSGLSLSLSQALFLPRAEDGGLFMPSEDLNLRPFLYLMDEDTSFQELVRILSMEIFKDDLTPALLKRLERIATDIAPTLHGLDDTITLLELFHGPTSAFQDFSMAFLAALMSSLKPADSRVRVLIPSSGDSACSAAHAFSAEAGIDIILLCPREGLRGINRNHLARNGGNARIIAVQGDFQDCLRLSHAAFSSESCRTRHALTSATTLNPGRLLAQLFPYFYGFINMKKAAGDFYFDVPSGNYGNFSSGLLAWKWGMPVSGFISAAPGAPASKGRGKKAKSSSFQPKQGWTLPDYLAAEEQKIGIPNFSDVANPENYERIRSLSAGNPAVLRAMIRSDYITEDQAKESIRQAYEEFGVFLDPYTAMGYAAAKRSQKEFLEETGKIILMATGHPWKYADFVEEACGKRPSPPSVRQGFEPDSDAVKADNNPDIEIEPELNALDSYLSRI